MTSLPQKNTEYRPSIEQLKELFWQNATDDVRVYAIIDGFWAKGLYGRLLASPDISWAHMFQGDVALNNIQDAPFIIALKKDHKLFRWLVEEGWGNGWGIYFLASTQAALDRYGPTRRLPQDMAPSNEERVKLCNLIEGINDPLWLMRNHFRRFSDVEFEDDARVVDFRYYDPATLRVYLPSCNNYELWRFLGPVQYFFAEGYSEIEASNNPQDVYSFSAQFNYQAPVELQLNRRDPPMLYEGWKLNLLTGKRTNIKQFSSHEGIPERQVGIYPMIRTEQKYCFEQSQINSFTQKMTENMMELLSALKRHAPADKLYAFVARQLKLARSYQLKTEAELLAFTTCAVVLGTGFDQTHNRAAALLNNNAANHTGDIAQQLTNLAKMHLRSGGSHG